MVCGRVDTGVPTASPASCSGAAVPRRDRQRGTATLVPSGVVLPLPEPLRRRERLEIKPSRSSCCIVRASPSAAAWARRRKRRRSSCPSRASLRLCRRRGRLAGRPHRAESREGKPPSRPPRDALIEVQAIERLQRLGLQPLGPTGLGRFAPENCRQDFTFEEDEDDDVSIRWVEFNHRILPQASRRRMADQFRRGLSLSGRPAELVLERRRQRDRDRLVRPRPGHRDRRQPGAAAAAAARPVRSRRRRHDAGRARHVRRRAGLWHAARRPAPADSGLAAQGHAGGALRSVRRRPRRGEAKLRLPCRGVRLASLERALPPGMVEWSAASTARDGAPLAPRPRSPRRPPGAEGHAAALPGGGPALAAVPGMSACRACSPTTWASARPSRRSPTSWPRRRRAASALPRRGARRA